MRDEIRISHARILRVRPGDVVIIESEHDIPEATAEVLKSRFAQVLAEAGLRNVPVSVLGSGTKVKVMRAEEVA